MSSLAELARQWRSSRTDAKRQHAKVFDALTETIREKQREQGQAVAETAAQLSPTHYFAAVLSALREHADSAAHAAQIDDDDGNNRQSHVSHGMCVSLLAWLAEVLARLAAGVLFAQYGAVSGVLGALLKSADVASTTTTSDVRHAALKCAVALVCHAPLSSQLRAADAWRALKPHAVALLQHALLLALAPPDSASRQSAVAAVRAILASPPPPLAPALSHAVRRACERALLVDDAVADAAALDDAVAAALASGDDVVVNAQRVLALLGADLPAGSASLLASLVPADAARLVGVLLPCLRVPELLKTALTAVERAAATPAALAHDDALRTLSALCALPKLSGDVLPHYSDAIASLCTALGRDVVGPILSDIVQQLLPLLRHTDATVARSAAAALERVLATCLLHVAELEADSDVFLDVVAALEPMCTAVRECLRAPYRPAWPLVLGVLTSLATNLGAACEPLLGETLVQIAELYAAHDSGAELQYAMRLFVAAMMRAMGPSKLLALLPLQMDADDFGSVASEAREWLLPLLRENVSRSRVVSLDLFTDDLIPLADALLERAEQLQASDAPTDAVLARMLQQRVGSLWALLPLLCVAPPRATDVASSFARLAPRLARVLESEPLHRAVAAQALAALVDASTSVLRALKEREGDDGAALAAGASVDLSDASVAAARANVAVLAAQAPKFLPRLVNALAQFYDPNAGAQPNAVTATAALCHAIGSYGRIAAPEFATLFFGRVLDRLADAQAAAAALAAGADVSTLSAEQQVLGEAERAAQRYFLTTVAGALAPALVGEQATRVLGLLTPQLTQASDRRLQKVSFRALEALCRDGSDAFFDANWSAVIAPLLVDSMASAVPAAKRLRLLCIASALERRVNVLRGAADALSRAQGAAFGKKSRRRVTAAAAAVSTLALELLPSVILCTSEHNKRARVAAMSLIDGLSDAMRRAGDDGGADDAAAAVRATTFLEHVAAGLAGASPLMLAATTRVLARVLRNYRDLLSDEVVGRFCDIVFMLLGAADKQQAKAAVIFARAALSVRKEAVRERLAPLLGALSNWLADPKHRFRNILRLLLERLVVRFGLEAVAPHLTNASARRVLTGIRQRANRRERLRTAAENGTSVRDAAGADAGQRKRRAGGAEGGDVLLKDNDDPLDFLDNSSMHKVVSGAKKRGARALGRDGDDGSLSDGADDSDTPLKMTADGRLLVDDDDDDGSDSGDDVNDSDSDESDDERVHALPGAQSSQWRAKNKRAADDADRSAKRVAVSDGGDHDGARRGTVKQKPSKQQQQQKKKSGDDDSDSGDAGGAAQPSAESVRARRRTRRIEARRRAVRAQIAERQGKGAAKSKTPVKRPGAEFKARRARGDALKPGELQPYAYVPLNPAALNQRRRKDANAELVLATEKRKRSRKR